MINAINEIKQIIKDEVPLVYLTSPRRIEPVRQAWPCCCVTRIGDKEKKGIRTVRAAVDIYASDEIAAEMAAAQIDDALRVKGFYRDTARDKPESLASSLRLVYIWTESTNRNTLSLTYKSGGFIITMHPNDESDPLFELVTTEGLYPMIMRDVTDPKAGGAVPEDFCKPREVTLSGIIRRSVPEAKTLLGLTMSPIRIGELIVGKKRLVCQVIESPDYYEDNAAWFSVRLLAQPMFEDANESNPTKLYGFKGGVEFPMQITQNYEFGIKRADGAYLVANGGDVPVGMRLHIYATGDVVNPSIRNTITGAYFKFTMTMQVGDELHISTIKNCKSATLVRNKEYINALLYLDPESTILELQPGDNFLRAEADDGAPLLEAETFYRQKYTAI
jgi:hypothetical protein